MIKLKSYENLEFKFFCDVCAKEIKDNQGECIFPDSIFTEPSDAVVVHYECGQKFDAFMNDRTGNTNLETLLQKLTEAYK